MSKRTVGADAQSFNLIDVVDQLNRAGNLLQAAHMAASDLTVEYAGAMQAIIDAAIDQLDAAREALQAAQAREATPTPSA